jgi:2-aminoadipate transaminase
MADSVHHHWRREAPNAIMALRSTHMDTRLRPSPIRAMLDHQREPAPIALAAGRPAAELIPHAALAAAAERALRAPAVWRYAGSLGHPDLRAWVAARLVRRGVAASAEQVLITNGGQHALLLAALAVAAPGTAVAVESPGYPGAHQALAVAGAELLVLPADPAQLGALARRRRLALVACMPSAHNPCGGTLSEGQRQRLAGACTRERLTILEDDAYHELWFDDAPPPPLAARHRRTLIAGSFSKILAPGLRLGWLAVPEELVGAVTLAMHASALHANGLAQATVWEWLRAEDFEAHLARLRAAYRRRRDALLAALARHWPGAQPERPAGGLFAWLPLPGGGATALARSALAAGVAVLPGGAFHLAGAPDDHLRLCFASEPPARLRAATALLARSAAPAG